jgi:UDP-N-acetylglucosamine diphosphorylase / glucose-1-phosphate thymidylyltransferase / UDP-N-acetylgalactosamine diphosphorylase / glucosamine-1-phosphate N-acetyltransferase / galactosamine-1-phosphate N-acetyltransferase
MKTILIFAGRSTRFWPLKEKSLFPVMGSCLLTMQVQRLREAGCKDILLVAGKHNLEEAKSLFPDLPIVEQRDLLLGMRGALLSALPRCKKEGVLIVSGNDVIEADAYKSLLMKAKNLREGGLILARKVKAYFPGGYLSVRGTRIHDIVEKPGEGKEPSSLVNIVAHVHADASIVLAALKTVKPSKDDGYEVALKSLLKDHRYEAVRYEGSWFPVKYPWHLLDLLGPLTTKPNIDRSASIHPTAVIEGDVVIGPKVRVLAHATVVGPCFIGEGSIIANNALVRGSSLGKQCVIGYGSEVARSILADRVWTHMSYVGDSIIDRDTSLGGGTMTGNLRLDEELISSMVHKESISSHRTKLGAIIGARCRTGIHTSIAPGIKIGADSFIHSAELVSEDIPDGSFVKGGQQRLNTKRITKKR